MQKSHHGVNIGTGKKNTTDREGGFLVRGRRKLRRGEKLSTQVWGGAEEKPILFIGRECELCLAARSRLEMPFTQTRAIGASAIPLRETAASRGA